MRTDKEIHERIKAVKDRDWMGTIQGDLIACLPFDEAKRYLKDSVTADDWGEALSRDRESVLARMLDYMEFAWSKANGNRGLSAGRSLDHMQAWLWLLGEDEAAGQLHDYDYYGKPQLRAICEHYGWDWTQWDDGQWTDGEMSDGSSPKAAARLRWASEGVAA